MVALTAKANSRFKQTHGKSEKVAIKMDIGMLNAIIGFCFKKSTIINKKALTNMKRLFDIMDESVYQTNEKLEARFDFIKRALEGRLQGIDDPNILMDYCQSDSGDNNVDEILHNIPQYSKLSYESIRYINNSIADRLQYAFIVSKKDDYYRLCERIETGDYKSFKEITKEFADLSKDLLNETRKSAAVEEVNSFSLADENFQDNFKQIVEVLRDPARTLTTGIQALNGLLVGGYQSKRLYMYCGLPKPLGLHVVTHVEKLF